MSFSFSPDGSSKSRMKPSAFSTRAMSTLMREFGTTTVSWRATCALRMRVSMSAIGSEMFMGRYPLPARLHDAGELAVERQLPEADAAEAKLPHEGARAAALVAAVVLLDLEPGRPPGLDDHRNLSHVCSPSLSRRSPVHPELASIPVAAAERHAH